MAGLRPDLAAAPAADAAQSACARELDLARGLAHRQGNIPRCARHRRLRRPCDGGDIRHLLRHGDVLLPHRAPRDAGLPLHARAARDAVCDELPRGACVHGLVDRARLRPRGHCRRGLWRARPRRVRHGVPCRRARRGVLLLLRRAVHDVHRSNSGRARVLRHPQFPCRGYGIPRAQFCRHLPLWIQRLHGTGDPHHPLTRLEAGAGAFRESGPRC